MQFQEIEVEQGTQEWLALRRKYRPASETPAVMGLSPWQSKKDVIKAHLGLQSPPNFAMRRGSALEPIARETYGKVVGALRPAVIVSGDYLASLDGIDFWNSFLVEIKCPMKGKNSDLWKQVEKGEVPKHYYAQVQHQLMVSNFDEAHFYVFDGADGITTIVKPDPEFQKEIRNEWDQFWEKELCPLIKSSS